MEPLYGEYCLLTGGRCSHYPLNIVPNSFFLAEPYDAERTSREDAIKKVLLGYPLTIADQNVMNIAVTCKICNEIQSCQFGIVDITGLNKNALIELGMLYGFNKPVVILVKESQNLNITIPSNIRGIEQIRYGDFDELASKLESVLKRLFQMWKNKGEYIISLGPMLDVYLTELELAINTKRLKKAGLEGRIVDFATIGDRAFVVIDKGENSGVKRNMLFEVSLCQRIVTEECLEEDIGLILVHNAQKTISLALPLPRDPTHDFWRKASERTEHPMNILRPYLPEHYEDISEEDLGENARILRQMLRYIYIWK
jgi:hypothetical protein